MNDRQLDPVATHNRAAWNRQATAGSRWTTPVSSETIQRARAGRWRVILTPKRTVPADWFGDLKGRDVLCLASGGGQQAPVLAAVGARVVSFDLSEEQLGKDRLVADRDGLELSCVEGDMRDLSCFGDASFDLIFNPVSTAFVPDLQPVWSGCARILRGGGRLLTGFMNPSFYLFDPDEAQRSGELTVRFPLPYTESNLALLSPERAAEIQNGEAMEFSHSLEDQIGGQIVAGFRLAGLYEDHWSDDDTPLNPYSPTTIATLAIKPA